MYSSLLLKSKNNKLISYYISVTGSVSLLRLTIRSKYILLDPTGKVNWPYFYPHDGDQSCPQNAVFYLRLFPYGVNDSKFSSLLTRTFDLVITVPLEVIHCLNIVQRLRLNKINHLTPNGHYMGCTAQLTSRCWILYIYSTNIRTEHFKHAA